MNFYFYSINKKFLVPPLPVISLSRMKWYHRLFYDPFRVYFFNLNIIFPCTKEVKYEVDYGFYFIQILGLPEAVTFFCKAKL